MIIVPHFQRNNRDDGVLKYPTLLPIYPYVLLIDNSQYRLLFGFFLLYTDRVSFELLDSAALL
jgi:hypothetical protein